MILTLLVSSYTIIHLEKLVILDDLIQIYIWIKPI